MVITDLQEVLTQSLSINLDKLIILLMNNIPDMENL